MRRVQVVLGDVIDGHIVCRFYLTGDDGRRHIGTLAVPHTELWIIEHMIESAESAAEITALLDRIPKAVGFELKVGP